METYGIEYLRAKLANKATRVKLRYNYYEMKNKMRKISALIPPEFRNLTYALGWCAKGVDSLSDRLIFDSFDNDDFMIGQIYSLNNADILFNNEVLSALISSCCFTYIDGDEEGYPRLECIDGANATGIIDASTYLLREGYAVLERDKNDRPVLEAYFLPYRTEYYENGKPKPVDILEHKAPYPLLVPVINRPDARRHFGHSRITRSCMDIVQSALRTILRTEVAAEFYSVPQKYVVGMSQDAKFDNRKATLSSFLKITNDEDGNHPILGQFQQQSMAPHLEHMKMLASMFAGETGLTLDDLGFSTGNPMSYDAIKASHESLRATAFKAQQTFGSCFVNAGYLAACLRDDFTYKRSAFADTKAVWRPLFEPDASALGAVGDAVYKINEAVPGFIGPRSIHKMTGLESDSE